MKDEGRKKLEALVAYAESAVREFAAKVNAETSTKEEAIRRFEEYIAKHKRKMAFEKGAESAAIVIEADALLTRLRECSETEH